MKRPYSPPLACLGLLADRPRDPYHAYHKEHGESLCGIDPRWRSWHTVDVVTRPIQDSIRHSLCSACYDLLLEEMVLRSLERLDGRGGLDELVADIPDPGIPSKKVERAIARLIGKHELEAYILPGNYPNRVEYRLP